MIQSDQIVRTAPLAFGVLLFAAAPASAAAPPSRVQELERQAAQIETAITREGELLKQLQQEIEALKRGDATPATAEAATPSSKPLPQTLQSTPERAQIAGVLEPNQVAVPTSATGRREALSTLGPTDQITKPANGVGLSVSATNGSSQASISFGASHPLDSQNEPATATDLNWNITLSAPVAKGDGPTAIASLNQLTNGLSLKFQLSKFSYRTLDAEGTPLATGIEDRARAACLARAKTDSDKKDCAPAVMTADFVSSQLGGKDAAAYRRLFQGDFAYEYGGNLGLGYNSYSYLNSATTKTLMSSRVPLSAGVYGALYPTTWAGAFVGSLDYLYQFKEGKSGTLCPAPTGAVTTCATGAVGKPQHDDSYLAALEYRQIVPVNFLFFTKAVGFSPEFEHDFHDGNNAIDLPIYFVPDTNGNLLGGLRLGYTTKDHDVTVGVFVGTAFSLSPAPSR